MESRSHPITTDLIAVMAVLEEQLARLDTLGAGIAAVHVNAAIEQLRDNLQTLRESDGTGLDMTMLQVSYSRLLADS